MRSFTRTKLVFDFDPRAYAERDVRVDLQAAGWHDVRLRPFLLPQRARVPGAVAAALGKLEPLPGEPLRIAPSVLFVVSVSLAKVT